MPRHGENIYKRRDGRYEGRYVIGKNATGKTRFGYVYGYQYAEVRNTLLRKKAELLQTVDRNPSRCATLLREWLHRWLESELLGSIKESSYQAYLRQINLHLIPGLGHLRLAQVTPSAVCEFIAEMEASGLAYGTVKGVFRLLNAALRHAQETGIIAQNPCRKIKIQPRETAEQRVLNRSEQEALRKAAIAQGELSTLIGLYTGMRLGEVCALKWSDIDWEKRTIAVRRTVQRTARRTGGAQAAHRRRGRAHAAYNRRAQIPAFASDFACSGISVCASGKSLSFRRPFRSVPVRQDRTRGGSPHPSAPLPAADTSARACQRSFSYASAQFRHEAAGAGRRRSDDQRASRPSVGQNNAGFLRAKPVGPANLRGFPALRLLISRQKP